MEGSTSCAPRFSSFSEEEKAALIEKVTPQSTKSATKFWVRVVCDFAREKGISFDFATIEEGQLARLLEDFYCSLRKKDGTEYKRSSYLAARGAVQRELNRLEWNINIQSPAFARANKLLDATLKEKKREGREPAPSAATGISSLYKRMIDQHTEMSRRFLERLTRKTALREPRSREQQPCRTKWAQAGWLRLLLPAFLYLRW